MIADRIRRTTNIHLVRIGPALRSRAVPRGTSLNPTSSTSPSVSNGECTNPNISIRTSHDGKIVSSALDTSILAMAEFKHGLGFPLAGRSPFGVAGEAHAGGLEGRHDGMGAAGWDVDGSGFLEHFEGGGDLVEGELFCPFALVYDYEFEVVDVAGGVVVEGGYCGGCESHESGEGQPGEMHCCR